MDSRASIKGKVAIVTGGAGGIGAATARLLARLGASVMVSDVNLAGAEQVAAEIVAAGGAALPFVVDLAQEDSIERLVAGAVTQYGGVDMLINIAADTSPALVVRDGNIEHMEAEVWDRTFRVNVRGTMLCCKHSLPHMLARGGGSIVIIASSLGLQGNIVQAAYGASKAALIQLARLIATSHGKQGIRCNAISPGLTLSKVALETLPVAIREIAEAEAMTPLGQPEDIAEAVAFIVSEGALYMNGHNLVLDGGAAAHIPGAPAMQRFMDQLKS